jgi:ATP-binding cassette, subfamily C (CFTR/MRP), member 1
MLSMLFDIVRTRTIWLISSDHALIILFTVATASKAVMLLLELTEKRHALKPKYRSLPREATSGFANVSIFWWLNRILRVGAGKIIGLQELDGLEDEFDSVKLLERLQSDWLAGRQ